MADPSTGATPTLPSDFYDTKPLANYSGTILGVSITLLALVWLALTARLSTRFFITTNFGWDDVFIVLAVLVISTGAIAFCVSTKYGMGQHIYLIPSDDLSPFLLTWYLVAASYNTSTALIKISLLFQYLRVFERGTKTYRYTQILLIMISIWGFVYTFMAWGSCLPDPSAMWKMTGKGCYGAASSNTVTVVRYVESHAAINVIFDVAVFVLAFRLLFAKDAQATRTGMMVLLFMGLISVSFAIWRLADIVTSRAGIGADLSWHLAGPTLLSFCEIYIACLTASTPFFWPIIVEHLNKILVKYEFNITTESRYHGSTDDNLELAPAPSWTSDPKATGRNQSVRSMEDGGGDEQERQFFTDEPVHFQADTQIEDFRTVSAVQTGVKRKPIPGLARFNSKR